MVTPPLTPDPMKTQDQPIARLIHWYLELEDRHTAQRGAEISTPLALQPKLEDGPICLEQLNSMSETFVDVMR